MKNRALNLNGKGNPGVHRRRDRSVDPRRHPTAPWPHGPLAGMSMIRRSRSAAKANVSIVMMITTLSTISLGLTALLTSCTSAQVRAEERYEYRFVHGKTALIRDGRAWAPRRAPEAVHRAIDAGNRLQGRPYRYGGGHASFEDSGYDCSGTVSYLLHKAGLIDRTMISSDFLTYGEPGRGRWITIYARKGHVFMTIAGLRIDTGGTKKDTGPRWKPFGRRTSKFILRHPPGL